MLIHLYLFSFQELKNCENIRDLAGNNFEQLKKYLAGLFRLIHSC